MAYERAIGRREVDQNCNGEYDACASRTLNGELDLDSALQLWLDQVDGRTEFNGVQIASAPNATDSEKWRYWRVNLADGTKIQVNISRKSPGKMVLALEHQRIPDRGAVDDWKQYWKAFLKSLA